jgi:hypothetical protein
MALRPRQRNCPPARPRCRHVKIHLDHIYEKLGALAVAGGQTDQGSDRRRPCECGGLAPTVSPKTDHFCGDCRVAGSVKERALGIRPGLSTYRHVPSCAVARRRSSALCSARVLWSLGQTGAGPQHDTGRPSRSTKIRGRSASLTPTYQTQFRRRLPEVVSALSPGMK